MRIDYHNHDFFEVYFFISGRVTYMVEGKSYKLRQGDILLINNQELHKPIIESEDPYERFVIWVHPDFLIKQSSEKHNLLTCFETSTRNKYKLLRPESDMLGTIKKSFLKLEKICNSQSFGNDILKKVYLTELLVYLNRAFLNTHEKEKEIEFDIEFNEKVNKVIKYINDNLCRDLSLDKLSSSFFVSKYHLLHEFKKYTGYTIYQYIKQKRLILAKMLLKEGLQVTEVCMRCGFGDYSNFIRAFKKAFGVPPKKYYKMYFK